MIITSQKITIKQEIYNRLKNVKKPNESYSYVISRLLETESNVHEFLQTYGIIKSENHEEEKFILGTYNGCRQEIRTLFNQPLK